METILSIAGKPGLYKLKQFFLLSQTWQNESYSRIFGRRTQTSACICN
jgi:hypothetical protein